MRFLRTGVLLFCLPFVVVVVPLAILLGIIGSVLLAVYEWVMDGSLE